MPTLGGWDRGQGLRTPPHPQLALVFHWSMLVPKSSIDWACSASICACHYPSLSSWSTCSPAVKDRSSRATSRIFSWGCHFQRRLYQLEGPYDSTLLWQRGFPWLWWCWNHRWLESFAGSSLWARTSPSTLGITRWRRHSRRCSRMKWRHYQQASPFQYPSPPLSPSIWLLHQPTRLAASLLDPFSSHIFPSLQPVFTFQSPFHSTFATEEQPCHALSRLLPFSEPALPQPSRERLWPRCNVFIWALQPLRLPSNGSQPRPTLP